MAGRTILEEIVLIYKAKCNLPQDYAVAERLQLKGTTFSAYLKGNRRMPDKVLVQHADCIDVPFGDMICVANLMLKHTTDDDQLYWLNKLVDEKVRELDGIMKLGVTIKVQPRHAELSDRMQSPHQSI